MPGSFDPLAVFETLDAYGVEYIVIGGVAGRFHGSPTVTTDVDICPDRTGDNLDRLAEALRSIHARLRGVDDDGSFLLDGRSLRAGRNFTFTTDAGAVDILAQPAGTGGYTMLAANAVEYDLEGRTVRVAHLDDLIRMKIAAGRAKDRIEVEVLSAIRNAAPRS